MEKSEWLKLRNTFIGGSDASAIIGQNPYKSNIEVWQEKTGILEPTDIGGKPYVQYGIAAEEPLIALFALDYPQYQVQSNQTYEVCRNTNFPFVAVTPDATLFEPATGKKGGLEVKTTEILNSMHRENWKDRLPDNYFVQCLQYLLANEEWDFVILKAQLKTVYSIYDVRLNTRHYFIDRADVRPSLDYLLDQEVDFWKYVTSGKKPPLALPNI